MARELLNVTDIDTICEAFNEALDIDRDERGRRTRELPYHTINALTNMLSDTRRGLNQR